MDIQESLQKKKETIHDEIRILKKKKQHLKNILYMLDERISKKQKHFKVVDRKLANLDGRYKVISPQDVKRHNAAAKSKNEIVKTCAKLNKDQIAEIAKKLGVVL